MIAHILVAVVLAIGGCPEPDQPNCADPNGAGSEATDSYTPEPHDDGPEDYRQGDDPFREPDVWPEEPATAAEAVAALPSFTG